MAFTAKRVLSISILSLAIGACSATPQGLSDPRVENRETLPGVLIRDLDVYQLVGGVEYVKVPVSEGLGWGDTEKSFVAGTNTLTFDMALYYRSGTLYYKAVGALGRDDDDELLAADVDALSSAIDKTASLYFEFGYEAEDQFLPIQTAYVDPNSFSRLLEGKNAAGRDLAKVEYTGMIRDMAPSTFEQIDQVDIKWNDAENYGRPARK
jgi:hypothetical protein